MIRIAVHNNHILRMNTQTAVIRSVATLAAITERYTAAGKHIGQRATFGLETAANLRTHFKNEGLKGVALKNAVNDAIKSGSQQARVAADTLLSAAKEAGFVPDYADVSQKGNTMVVRFVKPEAPKAVEAPKPTKDDLLALLKSMPADEKAALIASLA